MEAAYRAVLDEMEDGPAQAAQGDQINPLAQIKRVRSSRDENDDQALLLPRQVRCCCGKRPRSVRRCLPPLYTFHPIPIMLPT